MNNYDQQKRNAFKQMKDQTIILDFAGCKYLAEIHLILKEKIGFPEYYGANWDALWDCLDDLFQNKENIVVEIHGYTQLEESLREYCTTMLEVFDDVQKEYPTILFKVIS